MTKCLQCGKDTVNPKFCNKSCAAKYNGHAFPKRGNGTKSVCPLCGGRKNYESQYCKLCRPKQDLERALDRTLGDCTSTGNARVKWAYVRTIARRVLEYANITKECKICSFSLCVDVCHRRPINDFAADALLREVNALENLMYLCPNHHAMLDRGLLII